MGEGLKRAFAATRATRQAACPVCGRRVTLRLNAMSARVPLHGPRIKRCPGSGAKVA